jgi:outer membrane protein assembly factor BamB
VAGAVAVFAQGDVLDGLRLASGHRLWSRAVSADVAGIWRWQNLVVVLTAGASGGSPVLTGLEASNGQPRWRLRIGAVVAGSSPTTDGGLALTVARGDGVLEVVDLSSGRVRWTVPVGSDADPPVAAGGGAVLYLANSQLTSYDDRTGHKRWTKALSALPGGADEFVWQASAGLVYLTGAVSLGGGKAEQVLLGVSAADGRVRWRVVRRFANMGPPVSLDPYAPGLISMTTSGYPGGASQDELDPATGGVRWHVVSPYAAVATSAGIVIARGPDRISMRDTLTGQTRWTARLTGGWLPLVSDPGTSRELSVFPARPLLVLRTANPYGLEVLAAFRMSNGHRAWQVTIRGQVAAPLVAVRGSMLVYTVIPRKILAP